MPATSSKTTNASEQRGAVLCGDSWWSISFADLKDRYVPMKQPRSKAWPPPTIR